MPQSSIQSLPNSAGATFRSNLNTILAALFSGSSGATAPTVTVAGQAWYDTAADVLKIRNAANTAWVTVSAANLSAIAALALAQGDMLYATGAGAVARLPKGAAGQVLTQNAGATAPVWATPPFTKSYVSPVTDIAIGGLYTFSHGFGELPKLVQPALVCTTSNNGWNVGDRIPFGHGTFTFDSNSAPALAVSTADIRVRIASNNLMFSIGINGSSRSFYSTANFDLEVRAWA